MVAEEAEEVEEVEEAEEVEVAEEVEEVVLVHTVLYLVFIMWLCCMEVFFYLPNDGGRWSHLTCKGARSRLRDFVTALRPALEDR